MRLVLLLLFALFLTGQAFCQTKVNQTNAIQFSGIVVAEEGKEIIFLPYTNISVEGTSRGVITETDGFFSIVVVKGETVVFSRIGYENARLVIPDTLTSDHYSIVQVLNKDTILLPEAVIYPWPSRENFKEEFLAMDVENEMQQLANENLDALVLAELRDNLPRDSRESVSIMLRNNAEKLRTRGQLVTLNILNPLAWKKFIDKWRSGGFKKKDKEKNAFDIFVKDKIENL